MTERPILFSGPMVRALLDGRKTQTRRVVKHRGETPPIWATHAHELKGLNVLGHWRPWGIFGWSEEKNAENAALPLRRWPTDPEHPSSWNAIRCPYGFPGDRLWVKETHAIVPRTAYAMSEGVPQTLKPDDTHDAAVYAVGWERSKPGRWRPSIHMPRWASRLTLAIADVRVERLQDISEADALAEGIQDPSLVPILGAFWTSRDGYARLWEHINGKGSWAANPWVWAVTFEVERA